MTTTPAGWYPDPYGSPLLRWWDGTQWTDATHAPEQAAGAPPQPQFQTAQSQTAQSQTAEFQTPQFQSPQFQAGQFQSGQFQGGQFQPGPLPGADFGAPRRQAPVWPWIVGGVTAVVVLALVIGGAVVLLRDRAGSGIARPEVTATAPQLDQTVPPRPVPESAPPLPQLPQPSDGRIQDSVTGLSYAYPGDQWQVPESKNVNDPSDPRMPLWTSGCHMTSQANYDGRGGDWVGSVYTAEVPQIFPYSGPESFGELSQTLLLAYDPLFYGIEHERKILRSEATTVSGKQGWVIEFEMDFTKVAEAGGLKWKKEKGAIVLVDRGLNARPAMLYVSVPDNLDQTIIKRVTDSLESR
ncbi:DUF2510 domain-containing protein [Microbispora sp. H11081]|uniref:DUF2510 domain-containing protein n=1 Tax=Microbispora sp. H11081 TaxID=2729107 RepID=UPI001475B743|nr:DUF2510 domain-containing protein [Microbispora sp. H11081]